MKPRDLARFPNARGESFEWLLAASRVGGTLASRLLPPSAQPGALTGGARQGPTRKASWPQLQDAGFARVSDLSPASALPGREHQQPSRLECSAGRFDPRAGPWPASCRLVRSALATRARQPPPPRTLPPRPDPAAIHDRAVLSIRPFALVVGYHSLSAARVAGASSKRRRLLSQSGALSRSAT
jgi:hypothetical protein